MQLAQSLVGAAYRTQQMGLLLPALAAQKLVRVVTRQSSPPLQPELQRELDQRFRDLLQTDLDNVRKGLYPEALLFQFPLREYGKLIPTLMSELPRTLRRKASNAYQDLPSEARPASYPPYFRRTFHWQTDGYLSLRSAELYDVSVEWLFLGTADIMRRQVVPPITRYLNDQPEVSAVRLLDVACGTGRTLLQIARAHPELQLYGLDLSPYYVQQARRVLGDVAHVSLVAENAESMPFRDHHFDVLTSVYLFHELPRNARRNVWREMFRVLKPGGLLVIEDSAQVSESPSLAPVLQGFSEEFHEPFYRDYIADDLSAGLTDVGFVVEAVQPHMVAKVVVAKKPLGS